MDLSNVNKATFPLPTLGSDLENLSSCVHEGRGFFVLRGLDPILFSKEDNVVLYLGVSSYIAERRGRQNQDGMMLSNLIELHERTNANFKAHITDIATPDSSRNSLRSVYSNLAQVPLYLHQHS